MQTTKNLLIQKGKVPTRVCQRYIKEEVMKGDRNASGTGKNYRAKIERKKAHMSSTPGKDKPYGKANFMQRYFAKRSRAYKHRDYSAWYQKTLHLNNHPSVR